MSSKSRHQAGIFPLFKGKNKSSETKAITAPEPIASSHESAEPKRDWLASLIDASPSDAAPAPGPSAPEQPALPEFPQPEPVLAGDPTDELGSKIEALFGDAPQALQPESEIPSVQSAPAAPAYQPPAPAPAPHHESGLRAAWGAESSPSNALPAHLSDSQHLAQFSQTPPSTPHQPAAPARPRGQRLNVEELRAREMAPSQAMKNAGQITSDQLARVDDETLIQQADVALDAEQYKLAVALLREANRRYPLRKDIKKSLHFSVIMLARTSPDGASAPPSASYSRRIGSGIYRRQSVEEAPAARVPVPSPRSIARFERPSWNILPYASGAVGLCLLIGLAVIGWPILQQSASHVFDLRSEEERRALVLLDQANLAALTRPAEALDKLNDAIALDNLSDETTLQLKKAQATCFHKLGNNAFGDSDYQDAIKQYKLAVKNDPMNPKFHADLGTAYYYLANNDYNRRRGEASIDKEKLRNALGAVEESLKLEPEVPANLNLAANVYVKLGQTHEAYPYWQRIIKVVDDKTDPFYRIAERALRSHGIDPKKNPTS
jgi:tetratricopeptide (TPR) repeat protein